MCNHTGELHDVDEVGTYCLICEMYDSQRIQYTNIHNKRFQIKIVFYRMIYKQ